MNNVTIFTVNCVLLSVVLVVAGSKIEAIDGQNVTISFDIYEVEKADIVKIIFKEDNKEYAVVIAQVPWVYDDPLPAGVTLMVRKDRLSVIIQDVNIFRSGLYIARVFIREKVSEVNATLVVNKVPVSSTISPPHSSSSPTPPRSSDLQWLYALIPVAIIIIFIIFVCLWKHKKILVLQTSCFNREKESGSSSSDHVSVSMNGGGETAKALLTVTRVC